MDKFLLFWGFFLGSIELQIKPSFHLLKFKVMEMDMKQKNMLEKREPDLNITIDISASLSARMVSDGFWFDHYTT